MNIEKLLTIFMVLLLLLSCEKDSSKNDASPLSTEKGTISYTLDNSASQSMTLSDKVQEISVIDKRGIKWKLSVPPQVLASNVTIKMTAVGDITQEPSACTINSGVIFEPDGFRFDTPAKLTVELPASTSKPYMFFLVPGTGTNDSLTLETATKNGNVFELNVCHFSGLMSGQVEAAEAVTRSAIAECNSTVTIANGIIKQPISIIPPPYLKIDFCSQLVEDRNKLEKFIYDFPDPEMRVINRLIALKHQLEILGSDKFNADDQINALLDRLVKKTKNLLVQYGNTEETFHAIYYVFTDVLFKHQLSGGKGEPSEMLSPLMVNMVIKIQERLLDYVKTKHDYTIYEFFMNLDRFRTIGLGDNADMFEKLKKAYNFELTIENETKKNNGDFDVVYSIRSKMQLDDMRRIAGEGDISFIAGQVKQDVKCSNPWAIMGQSSKKTTTKMGIICADEKVYITYGPIKSFTPFTETSQANTSNCVVMPVVSSFAYSAFVLQSQIDLFQGKANEDKDDFIKIEDNFENKNSILMENEITKTTKNGYTIKYLVKLTHNPL